MSFCIELYIIHFKLTGTIVITHILVTYVNYSNVYMLWSENIFTDIHFPL